MNAFNAASSSTHVPTSLRTRNRRLVSVLDDDSGDDSNALRASNAQTASPFYSPYGSRAASPIPSKHPSRSSSLKPVQRNNTGGRVGSSGYANDFSTQLNGLWGNSWTAIQGLASNVLGSDISAGAVKDKAQHQRRRQRETHSPSRIVSGPAAWGPPAPGSPHLGVGSQEERQAMVRAKKREEMLMSNGYASSDNPAQYKRRNSDDFESMSVPPGDTGDGDARVYIHHVRPEDTLAGISIKFNCPLAVLKKSNRMWANDTIQARKTVMLPVDECGIKGRPLLHPNDEALLEGGSKESTLEAGQEGWPNLRRGSSSTIKAPVAGDDVTPSNTAPSLVHDTDLPWTHESWVTIDNHSSTVEIVRMPRRDLGYFPRARRKSNCFSDVDVPSISFDLSRRSTSITSAVVSASNSPPPKLTEIPHHQPQRKKSTSSSSAKFASQMHGPGGVGRLVGKSPVRGPGPADDKLNRIFAPHLPNIAPPSPSQRVSFDSEASYASGGYTAGGPTGLENVGGAIEGWVRKMASRAARVVVEPGLGSPLLTPRGRVSGAGAAGAGDLIELSDASEMGDEEAPKWVEEDDWERGRRRTSALDDEDTRTLRGRAAPTGFKGGAGGKKKGD